MAARASQFTGQVIKVARPRADEIIADVEEALDDDGEMQALFQANILRLGWTGQNPSPERLAPLPEWLQRLYRGPVSERNLKTLMG